MFVISMNASLSDYICKVKTRCYMYMYLYILILYFKYFKLHCYMSINMVIVSGQQKTTIANLN